MEYTNGFKVIEIKFQGESYNGFYKVTRKGVVTVETRSECERILGRQTHIWWNTHAKYRENVWGQSIVSSSPNNRNSSSKPETR